MAKKRKIKTNLSLEDLGSKYPGSGLGEDYLLDSEDMLWVPSSSPIINYQIGGGAAYGRIVEIAGKESSGKSLLAMDFIKSAQELGGVGIFVDAELAFSKSWAVLNGLDMSLLHIFEENIIEIIADFVAEVAIYYRSTLTNNEPIVLVVDSIAALDTKAAMETSEADSKAEMGNRAKAVYKMLRLRNRLWHKLGITVIFINQLRDKINTGFGSQYQEKVTTVGGNSMKFYASQRIFLEAKKQVTTGSKTNKRRTGIEVEFSMKKNKLAIPRSPRRMGVIFDPDEGDLGFDKFEGLSDILVKNGTIVKNGNSYSYDGEQIAASIGALQDAIEDDKELREDLLFTSEILTIDQMQVRLDDEIEDRYPIDSLAFLTYADAPDEE